MSKIILTTKWQSSHSTLTVKDSVATWFSFVWITEHFSAQCENSHTDTFLPDSIYEKCGKRPHKYAVEFPMRVRAKPTQRPFKKVPNSMQFMGRDSWSGALAAAVSLGPFPQGMPLPR